ncbi:MAG: DoxX family membrane protein [Acidimicrobiales bacterium]
MTARPDFTTDGADTDAIETRRLGRGMAVIRILFGVTYLTNGLAKLFGLHRIEIGPYVANLINRSDARSILDVEVNKNALHKLPLIGRITNDLVLAHWSLFGWGLTAVEIVVGVLLLSGLASRVGALLALGPALFLFFVYFTNNRWLPEQPLGLVPLVVLALVPAGRWWGLDRRFADRGWPF